jgi:segregation and condensation protein B
VVGRPILYGTSQEFLIQFGLKSLDDLPSLEEFEELLRADFGAEAAEVAEVADPIEASPGAGASAAPPPGDSAAPTSRSEEGD